jgi:hypothetical protein
MIWRPYELGCCWVGLRGLEPGTSSLAVSSLAAVRPGSRVADWSCDVSPDALQAAMGVVHGLAPCWRGLCREPGRDRVDRIVRVAATGTRNGAAGPATACDQRIARPDIRPRRPVALRGLFEPGRTRNHLHPCDGWAGVHRRMESLAMAGRRRDLACPRSRRVRRSAATSQPPVLATRTPAL